MDPKLFAALGGGQPAQAPQQPAPAPAGSPAPGAGLSLFSGLAPQQQPMGAHPLEMGPMVADNTADDIRNGTRQVTGPDAPGILDKAKSLFQGLDPYTGKPR